MRGASVELVVVEDHGLVEEGADQVQRDRGDRAVVEQFAAHARRQLDGVGRRPAAALRQPQARAAVDLARAPAPGRGRSGAGCGSASRFMPHSSGQRHGRLQEQPGDAPQRVAALHRVDVGRVRAPARTAARRPARPAARWRAIRAVIGRLAGRLRPARCRQRRSGGPASAGGHASTPAPRGTPAACVSLGLMGAEFSASALRRSGAKIRQGMG